MYVRYQTSDHMKVIEVIQDGLSDNSKCGCNIMVIQWTTQAVTMSIVDLLRPKL